MVLFLLIRHFLLQIDKIELPRDRQDRMKGFGYIEFRDKSSLLVALQEGELVRSCISILYLSGIIWVPFRLLILCRRSSRKI